MAQQRISFSIATHPPVHPPVASPAEPSAKSPSGNPPSGNPPSGNPPSGNQVSPKARNGISQSQGGHSNGAKPAKLKNGVSQTGKSPAAERGGRKVVKAVKAKISRAKPSTSIKPITRQAPAETTAQRTARSTPPLLPRRRFVPRLGHSMGTAAGLAAAAAAIIVSAALVLQLTFDPDGEASVNAAASLVARIAPGAGRSTLTPAQQRTLSERLADVEHARYRKRYSRAVRVGRGDRLLQLLILEGVPRQQAFEAIQVLAKVFDLRKLRAGQRVELMNGIVDHTPQSFVGLRFELGNGAREISVMRHGSGPFTATDVKKQLRPELVRGTGSIQTSLYVAGLKAGVPPAVMIQLIQIYSFDVDFQREIRKGDTFRVLFRNYYDDDGKLVRQGDILYASLTLRGGELELFRFAPRSGHVDYFNAQGHSVRKALMRTPIDGARLTSRFGRRRHPVLGYTRAHVGVDFAAPPGTPIYAAGDGMIVTRVRTGGYGNYIKIRHTADYNTAYAHMQRFAIGLAAGSRVRQGQVIGYVGSSGLSNGPHLHYEVHYRGMPVNPLGLKLATGQKLHGLDLREFMVRRTLTSNMYLSHAKDVRLASAPRRRTGQPAN